MTLPRPSIVLFDMDGTAVRHINPRLLHILEWLDDTYFRLSNFCGWLFQRGAKGPIDIEPFDGKRRKPKLLVHRAIHKFRRKPVEQIVEPCPGIYAVLDFLRARGIPMALISNGLGKGYGHDVLDRFDLEDYFSVRIFREDIRKSKPNPEPLLLALQRMERKLKPDDVIWYIGDRHKDVFATLAARDHLPCRIVPIAYGFNAAVAIVEKGLGPEHIVMSYHDMVKQLKKMMPEASIQSEEKPVILEEIIAEEKIAAYSRRSGS